MILAYERILLSQNMAGSAIGALQLLANLMAQDYGRAYTIFGEPSPMKSISRSVMRQTQFWTENAQQNTE